MNVEVLTWNFRRRAVILGGLFLLSGTPAPALTTNQWTNAVSSLWREGTNWSAAQPPDLNFDVMITNAGTKVVTVDAATPAANLSFGRLTLSAPFGSSNTLSLVNLDGIGSLTSSGTIRIDQGGVLSVTNSTFLALNTFDIAAGDLVLDSGLVDSTPNFVDIRVGRLSGGAGTVLLNGGRVQCFGFRLGALSGSQGNCVVNGGTLWCKSVLSMGEVPNSPGALTIFSGQVIATNDITKVGNLASGVFNQSGGSSSLAFWSIADNADGTANISGGQVTITPRSPLDIVRIGNFGTGQLHISESGSVWARGEFHVADNPGVQGSVLVSGGSLSATNALVAIGRYGIGDLTVTNAVVWFTNTSVGRHTDATGTLNVQNGASVYGVEDLSIGRFTNATGYVDVSGGLLSLTNDSLWVGREGIGSLAVSGGLVRAKSLFVGMSRDGTNVPQGTAVFSGGVSLISSNMVVGTSLVSTGTVTVLGGGVLAVTNDAGTARLNLVNGSCGLDQGTLIADSLFLTNAEATLTFAAGKLRAGSITVANGAPFVLGDGVRPAILELGGGTCTFTDGLVINPNAMVTGCGTLVGPIVNNGTISTNCGAPIMITSLNKNGSTVSVSFSSRNGATNVLEFKNALDDPTWTSLLPGIVGDGGIVTQEDPTATNQARFYRVRVP